MLMITLYAKQKETQMHRTVFWTLWEKARAGCFKRTASKHVYYLGWNRLPAQVGCMRQAFGPGALGRPRGIGWRGRWEGGSGWGTHVNPWLIHFNVWQNPLQLKKKKNAFNISFKRRSAGIKLFFFFFLSEKLFISLSVLKYNFTGYRFLDNDFFFLSTFSLFHLSVFACLVSEKSDEILMFDTL